MKPHTSWGFASELCRRMGNVSGGGLAILAFFLGGTMPVMGQTTNSWISVSDGSWETPANWSRGAAPAETENVFITNNGSFTVRVDNTTADTDLGWMNVTNLILGATSGSPTLLVDFTNASKTLIVGSTSTGITSIAKLANHQGNLIVSNGAFQTYELHLGEAAGASGVARFLGGTSTVMSANAAVGSLAFTVGHEAGSSGEVLVNGGILLVTNARSRIGGGGHGSVTVQSGAYQAKDVILGYTSGGRGELNVLGGNVTVAASLTTVYYAGGTGTVLVAGNGMLALSNGVTLGNAAGGFSQITVSNGTLRSGGTLSLKHNSELNIHGGSITAQVTGTSVALNVGDGAGQTGVVFMTGGSLVGDSGGNPSIIGNKGRGLFTMADGSVLLPRGVVVGNQDGGDGELKILGGTFSAGAMGVGSGSNSAGVLTVSGAGLLELTRPTYTLGVGHAVTNARAEMSVRDGGTLRFSGMDNPAITVYRNALTMSNAVLEFMNAAAANLAGGITNITLQGNNTFRLNNATNAAIARTFADGVGFNALELVNGNPMWRGASLEIGNGGALLVSNAAATVASVLTNQGGLRVVNSHVTFSSNVVLRGSYVSDPSTNVFASTLTVEPSGSLAGGVGDLFVFQKDFLNQSTNRTAYDLWQAAVLFTNSANHLLSLSNSGSVNLGKDFANLSQLATNFAIGQLRIASGNRVTIAGNQDSLTNALYVGWLDLPGIATNSYDSVTNGLFLALNLPNINLYYDGTDPRNDWLNAWVPPTGYNLWGGGMLLPIPEPSAGFAAGAGLLLLAFLRCNRRSI